MKNISMIVIIAALSVLGCSDFGDGFEETPQRVFMDCMDNVSYGGTLEVVVRTQEEFNQLFYQRFTRPLQEYWNAHYNSVLQSIRLRYPGLTDQQYADSVRKAFYSSLPFSLTVNCSQATIDFSKYTLLGQSTSTAGCRLPDYSFTIHQDDHVRVVTFKVSVLRHGNCEIGFWRIIWVIVPKLPDNFTAKFEKEYLSDG